MKAAEWTLPLTPRPAHWDQRITVQTPLKKAGAYLLTGQMQNGNISRISVPIRIFAARNDHVVPPKNSEYIYEHVSSTDKELIWLDNCYHVATLDVDKERVFEEAFSFVTKLTG